jgi:tetratricopeptide (TPR) repeat protein
VNTQSETGKGECLSGELISGYLEGTLTPVVKAACEVHLIACDLCRESLANLMRLLNADVSPEETAAIDMAVSRWSDRGLRAVPSRREVRVWRPLYLWLGSVAAILLVGIALWHGRRPDEDLIQQLLSKSRPFDARLSDQPYLPLTRTRSATTNGVEGLVEDMQAHSKDAYLIGRSYLVTHNYAEAIRQLRIAASDPKAPARVLNDLGVAYLERYSEGDAEHARQEFDAALAQDPQFSPAIFNLSLLYERQGKIADAQKQWQRYLELDGSSGWADEIRQKAEEKDLAK